MQELKNIDGYEYSDSQTNDSHSYLLPAVSDLVTDFVAKNNCARRLFDLGCGNGSVAAEFAVRGFEVAGVDPSKEGIKQATKTYPELRLETGSAYDDLSRFGQFPVVISLEVVEHVYAPRDYAKTLFSLVEPGGIAIVSTPYHGYLKNLTLALTGAMDHHFHALWDHGHIKFWSMKTLRILLEEVGFQDISYNRVGRIPALAKSMIARARRSIV